ncbi:LOW QUALITY PROTEIN: uncharacterized protein sip2 [Drosophila tropicalis]|uniref:LOW QUALITY PROTEIN: uncharacterized protein sip2 n=1 Tax=Drosophila tropicalis TaxID=46794 RepID=UPI0035ABB0D4
MSDLGKFQNNPAWREKLCKFLLKERSPPKKITQAAEIMEQAKESPYRINMPVSPKAELNPPLDQSDDSLDINEVDDTFSAMERMCDKSGSDPDSTLFQYLHSDDKEQIIHLAKERNQSKELPDDTFAAIERMCDKSVSDPNSTLFHYLQSEDKQKFIDSSKDQKELTEDYKEIETLNRLMADISTHEQIDMESPLKGVEHTLLEDIEAPSRFWDNDSSVSQDGLMSKKTSPVKMVGLLRPSTIIETNEADVSSNASSTNVSSLMSSFRTAMGGLKTNITMSSCYETATDTSVGGMDEAGGVSVDHLLDAAIRQAKATPKKQIDEPINTEETCEMENTIIELSSSSDEEYEHEQATTSIKSENVSVQLEDEEDENKENSRSINLNNTMEEMEYMMQKGLEYIAASSAAKNTHSPKAFAAAPSPQQQFCLRLLLLVLKITASKSPKALIITPTGSPKKLIKQNTFVVSPRSKLKSSPLAQKKVTSSTSCIDRFDIKMEQPKRKFFMDTPTKSPATASAIPLRHQMKLKTPTYDHIVSPIRAYTHKSGTAPLMSQFHKTGNEFSSEVMTDLEKGSEHNNHLLKPRHDEAQMTNPLNKSEIDGIDRTTARRLPKKAYIGSKIKHVVDERTPMPMPNVPKIQKYLNSAVEPTVLRHDGKMKLPTGGTGGGAQASHIPRPSNQSLADLSLASGDVSLYTMKDAQKF